MEFQRLYLSWFDDDFFGDSESGIGIVLISFFEIDVGGGFKGELLFYGSSEKIDIVKVDFILQLLMELVIFIFVEFDGLILGMVSLVNKCWVYVVENWYVWWELFLWEKMMVYVMGGSIQFGSGLGVLFVYFGNDWKNIYRVKEQFDCNWKEGKVCLVYLNGYIDSIYCL